MNANPHNSSNDIDAEDIKSLSDDEEDDDNEIKNTLLSKSQKMELQREGYCIMDPIIINGKIYNLCNGFIRENENKVIGITGIILKIIKYCQGRYDPKYYIELRSGSGDKDNNKIGYYLLHKNDVKLSKLLSTRTDTNDSLIELSKVRSDTLHSVCQYLGYHKSIEPDPIPCPIPSNDLNDYISDKWDAIFINKYTKKEIFEIILAANYMDIKCLLHLGCAKMACFIKGMDQREINTIIEKEESYRRQNTCQQQQPQQLPQQPQYSNYDDDLAQAIKLSLMDNTVNANGKWNCTACTFENIASNVLCEICFTAKQ